MLKNDDSYAPRGSGSYVGPNDDEEERKRRGSYN